MDEICYQPIGTVRSPFESPADVPMKRDGPSGSEGTIELDATYRDGLDGLDGFSHVVVLAHLHLVEGYDLHANPPFAEGAQPGVFATRSPNRPNPIAQSIVRLRDVDGETLHVDDVDLVDGTPVLDIKPFAPKEHECQDISYGWLEEYR